MSDVLLSRGRHAARVSGVGGRVLSYEVAGVEVLASDEPQDTPWYRSSLLVPWPNRVADGQWSWDGDVLQLPVNEPATRCALHGLVAYERFEVTHQDQASAALSHRLKPSDGYPFSIDVTSTYSLGDTGLSCSVRARKAGAHPATVALGVHPYLAARGPVDDVELQLPARTLVEPDTQWQELGRRAVDETELDFRRPRRVGSAAIDACWTDLHHDPDGRARSTVRFPDGDSVTLWGGSAATWLVVYNGDTLPGDSWRRSLAIEPCTAAPNALRSRDGISVLPPGAELELTWGIAISW